MPICQESLLGLCLCLFIIFSQAQSKCLFHKYDNSRLDNNVTPSESFEVHGSYRCEIMCLKRRLKCAAAHVTVEDDGKVICRLYRDLPKPFKTYPDTAPNSRLLVRKAYDFCLFNPCTNGGSCNNVDDSYKCTCLPDYTGETCEKDVDHTNECGSSPCQHNGTCVDMGSSYRCTCSHGYEGDNCHIKNTCILSSPCLNGGTCTFDDVKETYQCHCAAEYSGTKCETHCVIYGFSGEVMRVDGATKTVYMETSPSYDGRWIVLMRRQDGSIAFESKTWIQYKNGFGVLMNEFWLGNDEIHRLTTNGSKWRLRVDMTMTIDGGCRHAEYSEFSIGPESDRYRLEISGYDDYNSDAEDLLNSVPSHHGSTFDTQDNYTEKKSGKIQKEPDSGWWYSNADGYSKNKLTGIYGDVFGIKWGRYKQLDYADMKITTN